MLMKHITIFFASEEHNHFLLFLVKLDSEDLGVFR